MPPNIGKNLKDVILRMLEKSPSNRPNIKEVLSLIKSNYEKLKKNIWNLDSSDVDFKEFLRPPIQKFEIKNEKLLKIQEKVLREQFLDYSPRMSSLPNIAKSDLQPLRSEEISKILDDSLDFSKDDHLSPTRKEDIRNNVIKN